jgi:phosphoserine phosphatase
LLQEYHWGLVQGLTRREISERYPAILAQLQQDFQRAEIPGAEGMKKLFRRAGCFYSFLATLERTGRYNLPILIVSHGRFLQAFVQRFLAYDSRQGWPFSVSPASLTILEADKNGKRRLKLFNDTCHLRREGRGI